MNVQVHEETPTRKVFDIAVSPEEIAEELDRVVGEYARRVSVPGFRKGHVPRSLLEARFGASFEQETLERAVDRACRRTLTERKIVPLVPAEIEDLKFTSGGPLTFKAIVEVRPEVEAKDYKGIAVTRRTREVTDADIEQFLEEMRKRTAILLDVERPAQDGDVVTIDTVRLDAKGQILKSTRRRDYDVELGAEGLLPAFQEGLQGVQGGESRTVLVEYPAEFANADLAGKSVRFHVKIKKIREKKERVLDDNWAQEAFGVGTLDEVRARVRLNLEGQARLESREQVEEELVQALLARNPVPVPDRMLERMLAKEMERFADGSGGQLPPEKVGSLREELRRALALSIQREFLLDAIARQEGIQVTEREVGEELARVSQAGGRLARDLRSLEADERRRRVRDLLERRRLFDALLEQAQVREEKESESKPLVVPA